jgi:pimeloyl-ACP methyl ester carboxylesterase
MSANASESWSLAGTFSFESQVVRFGRLGRADLTPLVLLHGTPFSSIVWRRIAPHLSGRRQVFYFDLLGYGRSEMRVGQDVSLAVQGRLLAALLSHWRLSRPDVVAHDFGGCTALRAHLLHAAILPAYISGAAFRPLASPVMQLYTDPWTGATGQAAFYRQIAQMDQRYTDEIESRYGEIRCPVEVIWGEEDRWIPIERGRELARRITGSRLLGIPEAGHLVQEDAPEAIVAALLDKI